MATGISSLGYHFGNGGPQLGRNLWPAVNDCPQVRLEFLRRKQARNKLLSGGDRICPVFVRKCLCFQHFLNEAEGSRTLNLRIDSPML
jgi:hypothetical protein